MAMRYRLVISRCGVQMEYRAMKQARRQQLPSCSEAPTPCGGIAAADKGYEGAWSMKKECGS
jgi:hypothetical protein